ncbi:MAG: hypothetical protein LC770_03995 [Acidobacteria bacterium]|nr:hypothetical protein [Acidobacteriota bacterium]
MTPTLSPKLFATTSVYSETIRILSCAYRLPEEFEQQLESTATSAGATMSFFRHEEDYRPDGPHTTRSGPQAAPQTIGFDESPVGYSLASCSPAELTSASPAEGNSEPEDLI